MLRGTCSTLIGLSGCSPETSGTSYSARFDIYDEVLRRLGPTTLLAFGSLLISIPAALVLGTFSAIHVKRVRGGVVDVMSQIGIAVPAFWAGLLMVVVFGIQLGWLPTGGYTSPFDDLGESIQRLVMPTLALSLGITSVLTRYVRSAMLDVMGEDFIRTAMAKGRTRRGAALVHGRTQRVGVAGDRRYPAARSAHGRNGGDRECVRHPGHRTPAGHVGARA